MQMRDDDRELSTRGEIIVFASDSGSYAQILVLLRIERQIMQQSTAGERWATNERITWEWFDLLPPWTEWTFIGYVRTKVHHLVYGRIWYRKLRQEIYNIGTNDATINRWGEVSLYCMFDFCTSNTLLLRFIYQCKCRCPLVCDDYLFGVPKFWVCFKSRDI